MPRQQRKVPWLVWRGGVAYAYWYDAASKQTKRFSLRTNDAAEAANRFAAFLTEGGNIPVAENVLTVEQALDNYHAGHVVKHCADPRRQEDAIVHLKAFFVDTPIPSVDIPMSTRYAEARRTGRIGVESRRSGKRREASDSTIRRELNVLIAAANYNRRHRTLKEMPSIELPAERRLGQDDEAPFYTKSELSMLIDLAKGELRQFIELAYFTAARRASIEDLERPQVSWDLKRILLQKPGKRSTKKRQPIVPILPELDKPLRVLWDASTHRTRLFAGGDFYRPFRQHCEALGFTDRSHPHLLRHSRATHLLQDGIPLYAVARLLGDSLATVERVYGHHSHARLAEDLVAGSAARNVPNAR